MRLDYLFEPASVAVLGASANPSVGRDIIESLGRFGYSGEIYPVNPKYASILDIPCYPSLADLPSPPDVVAFCIGAGRIMENFRQSGRLSLCAVRLHAERRPGGRGNRP